MATLHKRALCLLFLSQTALGMEPLAALAKQPMWQAAKPITVNIDYDVPAFGTLDEISDLKKASSLEYSLAERRKVFAKAIDAHRERT